SPIGRRPTIGEHRQGESSRGTVRTSCCVCFHDAAPDAHREGDSGRLQEERAMTKRMGRVTCDLTISIDGYSAGLNQTEARPFGDDGGTGAGEKLHGWMFDPSGENRAEVEQLTAAKAFVMGRNMFGPVRGEWDRKW